MNKEEVIIEVSLIAAESFHDKSGEASEERASNKYLLVKKT